ncbi:MAG: hypothetical protein KF802_13510 [Bdellovibrionaceae bacterium]|nr:hypothetical protein [Pseudobdellovibrionaceae bacterium]
MNSTLKRVFLCGSFVLWGGCTSSPPTAEVEGAEQKASPLSRDEVLDRFSLPELASAANAFKVVIDEEAPSEPLLKECVISGAEALRWMMPLKELIDTKTEEERRVYVENPMSPERVRQFEACEKNCTCGAFLTLLEPVREPRLKPARARARHRHYLHRLRERATSLSPRESLTCARRQSWLCRSPLRSYLEREAANGAL